jgi:competence protein ComEC
MARLATILAIAVWLALISVARADEITPNDQVATGVVIRAEPTTQSDRLGLLRPGETLTLQGEAPGWWRITIEGDQTGYVSKRWTIRIASAPAPPEAFMFAHFVYVGQGDGAILEFPCGVAIIDTGGQYAGGTNGGALFAQYLDAFFQSRPHFNNTIDVLFTTHPHADHLNGLARLLDEEGRPRYRIRNVVDNGQSGATGSLGRQTQFRNAVTANGGGYFAAVIDADFDISGISNDIVDPIDCSAQAGVDPLITLYWGGWERETLRALGGRGREASNPNNQSLVIRIDFGEASFLFTGDLEDHAIEDMLALYSDNLGVFDVDVYQVGHHGSHNATTEELLGAMTAEIAVISMGDRTDNGRATARGYGHPRRAAIELMQQEPHAVSGQRETPGESWSFSAANGSANPITIERAIYGTGWEGNLVLRATVNGRFELARAN